MIMPLRHDVLSSAPHPVPTGKQRLNTPLATWPAMKVIERLQKKL